MTGISSIALKPLYYENKKKFNEGTELQNKEFSDGSGLELYGTRYRGLDPQIGRFLQIDPMSQLSYHSSPYSFANNNPNLFNDPLGLLSDSTHPQDLPPVVVSPTQNRPVVQVFIWSKETQHKDVGHTAIRIGDVVYGYYPTGGNGDGYGWKELVAPGSPGKMHVDSIGRFNVLYAGQEVTYFQLNLTPEQIDKLKSTLLDIADNPGRYNLLGNQCTSVAANSLLSAGVKIGIPSAVDANQLPSGNWLSPSDFKTILGSNMNRELITRIVKFVVGQ